MGIINRRLQALEEQVPREYEPVVPVSEEHAHILAERDRAGERFLALSTEQRCLDPDGSSPEVVAAARHFRDLCQLERYLLDGEEPPDYLRERLPHKGYRHWSPVV